MRTSNKDKKVNGLSFSFYVPQSSEGLEKMVCFLNDLRFNGELQALVLRP